MRFSLQVNADIGADWFDSECPAGEGAAVGVLAAAPGGLRAAALGAGGGDVAAMAAAVPGNIFGQIL
ncbi:hypothetical protein Tharo_3047 [Thauera aromatica K172]|uniref:Uncharacterized protein n=1 Tax=Thauera aromatica K172 TaxID=44139 RepID=A0A2R4BRH1_THAAR|nr:hypothetical protein Tharo_3047 [Thauera aromatica K172]